MSDALRRVRRRPYWLGALAFIMAGAAFLTAGGCADHFVSITDYRTSCTLDSECTPVATGNVCSTCCPNVAINIADLGKLEADTTAARCANAVSCDCVAVGAFCDQGECAIGSRDAGAR